MSGAAPPPFGSNSGKALAVVPSASRPCDGAERESQPREERALGAINVELLKRLCEAPGVPGREDQIRSVTLEALRPLVDEVSVDILGKCDRGKARERRPPGDDRCSHG